jgi:hypothetical protein
VVRAHCEEFLPNDELIFGPYLLTICVRRGSGLIRGAFGGSYFATVGLGCDSFCWWVDCVLGRIVGFFGLRVSISNVMSFRSLGLVLAGLVLFVLIVFNLAQ